MTKLRDERGIALPLAAAVLLTVSLLVVAVANNAMQSSGSANRDRSSKRALAAAEAGLQTAANRLNQLPVNRDECLTDRSVPVGAGGECPGHTFDLGNDASFTYYVTPAVGSGSCQSGSSCDERVITSIGSVKGETRRLQIRAEAQPARPPFFPVNGITGLQSIRAHNDGSFDGVLGSNGSIDIRRFDTLGGVELGPSGTFSSRDVPPAPLRHPSDFVLPAVPVGDTATNNANELVTLFNPGATYDPQNRDLTVRGNRLVLPPGDYNFCRIDFHNDFRIEALGPVRLFIDAPTDAVARDTGCNVRGGTWGSWDVHNSAVINPAPSPVTNFQLFVVGWDPATPAGAAYTQRNGLCEVDFHNTAQFRGSIFAPFCVADFHNNAGIEGAIATREISFHNRANFIWHDGFGDAGRAAGDYVREHWVECPPRPRDPTDPESGC